MYHSIIVSGKNLYDEWGLIPTSRPLINPPEVKTVYTKNPGSDGSIDFTDNLTGAAKYEARTGSWEFWIRPEDQWSDVYSAIMNYLHGVEHTVILEDDPSSIYHGRLSVSSWKSDKHNSLLVIDYHLNPYKEYVGNYDALEIVPEDYFVNPDQYISIKLQVPEVAVYSDGGSYTGSRLDYNIPFRLRLYNDSSIDIYPAIYVSKSVKISVLSLNLNENDGYESGDSGYIVYYGHENDDNDHIIYTTSLTEGYNELDSNLVLHPGANYWLVDMSTMLGTDEYSLIMKIGHKVNML